jgi:hypothetical protein
LLDADVFPIFWMWGVSAIGVFFQISEWGVFRFYEHQKNAGKESWEKALSLKHIRR